MKSLLEETKTNAEKLFTSITLLLDEAKKQQAYGEQIEQAGHVLARKKQEFQSEQEALKKEKDTLEGEKQFIVRQSAQIKVNEEANTRLKSQLEIENRELDKKREEILQQDKTLTEKIKQYAGLEEQKRDIDAKIALNEQEKVIDRERKALLDAREKRLGEREEYVNKLSQM